jgi:hypothetical protein
MATTTILTEPPTALSTTTTAANNEPAVYGCEHIESILKKHGDRVRQEYDSAMSVVIQPSTSKTAKVKVTSNVELYVDYRCVRIVRTLPERLCCVLIVLMLAVLVKDTLRDTFEKIELID